MISTQNISVGHKCSIHAMNGRRGCGSERGGGHFGGCDRGNGGGRYRCCRGGAVNDKVINGVYISDPNILFDKEE